MAIAGASFVAGPYTVTWDSLPLGIMIGDADVPTIEKTNKSVPIDRTDQYAHSTIDAIHMGFDCFFQMVFAEYLSGNIGTLSTGAALNPFGTHQGIIGQVGRLYSLLYKSLVLTAVTGTSAATIGPATLTASKAIIAPNWNARWTFGPQHRTLPMRFQVFPDKVSADIVLYTFT